MKISSTEIVSFLDWLARFMKFECISKGSCIASSTNDSNTPSKLSWLLSFVIIKSIFLYFSLAMVHGPMKGPYAKVYVDFLGVHYVAMKKGIVQVPLA